MIRNYFSGAFLTLLLFAIVLFGIHSYIFFVLELDGLPYFPIWTIYLFNFVLVLVVDLIIRSLLNKGKTKIFGTFMVCTMLKMILVLVFLLPLFLGKSDHPNWDVTNFFIAYFLFLGYEVFSLSRLLRK